MKITISFNCEKTLNTEYLLRDDEGRPFKARLINNFPNLLFEVTDRMDAAVDNNAKVKRHHKDNGVECLPEHYTFEKRYGELDERDLVLHKGVIMQRINGFAGSKVHLVRVDDGLMTKHNPSFPSDDVARVIDLTKVNVICDIF